MADGASAGWPRSFGRYTLLERVAVGGMAEIFRARTESLGGFAKECAIKRLHVRYSEDDEFVRMLLEEARIAARISHAAVAQIHDVGQVGSHYYIAMEYVEGQSAYGLLRAIYARQVQLPVEVACHIVMEVAAALHHAHTVRDAQGRPMRVVHRDVSPQNVLLSYEGDVKVVDFGIAKAAHRSVDTQSGVIKGKFYYMAPEQASGEAVDARCDIFAAGILLYELLTAHPCYDEEDNAVLLEKVQAARFEPPSRWRGDLDPALEGIVLRAMSARPQDRHATALELAEALESWCGAAGLLPSRIKLRAVMAALFRPEGEEGDAVFAQPTAPPPEPAAVLLPASVAAVDSPPPAGATDPSIERAAAEPSLRAAGPTQPGHDPLASTTRIVGLGGGRRAYGEAPTRMADRADPRLGRLRRVYALAGALALLDALLLWLI